MKRTARYLLVVSLLLTALPVLAARPQQQGNQGIITSPQENATVRGVVPILGTATINGFQFYKVEWGRGADPTEWHLIGSTYPSPIINGVLAQWDTTTVPDGLYSLRLHVVKSDGNYSEYRVRGIIVANKKPTETPTPKPEETQTPLPTRTPGPTATLAIVQPTAALARPSPTPTPVRPIHGVALPELSLGLWRDALCMGAGTMAAIMAVVGMVFALRRVL